MIFGRKKEKKGVEDKSMADIMAGQSKNIEKALQYLEESRKNGEIGDEAYLERRKKLESIKKEMGDMVS